HSTPCPDTPTTHISTLSLHDALPILPRAVGVITPECHAEGDRGQHKRDPGHPLPQTRAEDALGGRTWWAVHGFRVGGLAPEGNRSEEHTSELQSRENLVCRLLLEKKK